MKKRIVVVGSANIDLVMQVAEFPLPGETIMGCGFLQNHGGKGANQAVACARLGGETAFVGKVGQDSLGADTIQHLKNEGIDVQQLTQTAEAPSGTAFITVDSHGENSIIVNAGANGKLGTADIDAADDLLKEAAVVLMQLETPIPTLTYAAKKAHQYGAKVILNPAPAPAETLPRELLENIDLLIPNETEAQKIGNIQEVGEENLKQSIEAIQKLGVQNVVITLGSRGAAALENGELVKVSSPKVKPVDTTAAGDTFCGGFCVGLCEGKPLAEAISFACKAAALTCTRMGAQQSIPTRKEVAE